MIEDDHEVEESTTTTTTMLRPNRLIKHSGIVYALAGSLFLSSAMLLCKKVKRLTGPEVSILRTSVMSIIAFFQVVYENEKLFCYKGRRKLLFLRAVCSTVGSSALFTSILLITLPDASSVKYCSVVLTPFLARLTLAERLSMVNVVSALTSFFGVALIANPFDVFGAAINSKSSTNNFAAATNISQTSGDSTILRYLMIPSMTTSAKMSFGVALALITSICEAAGYCLGKKLSKTVPKTVIVFNMSAYSILLTLPVCLTLRLYMFTRTIKTNNLQHLSDLALIPRLDIDDLGYIIIAGFFSTMGHFCVVSALKLENAGLVSIVRASDILFSHIFQMIFFKTTVSQLSIVGSVLIVCSVVAASLWKIRTQRKTNNQTTTI